MIRGTFVTTALALVAVAPLAHAQQDAAARELDARDGVVLPENVRSLLIVRSGEIIRARPDANSARRGAAARDARLPALEAALGDGCTTHWIRVGTNAWVCAAAARLVGDPPSTRAYPLTSVDELLPYEYAFAAYSGVRTYRSFDDADNEDWAEELERGMAVAVDRSERHGGQSYVHTASGRWIAAHDVHFARASGWVGANYDASESADAMGFVMRAAFAWPTAEEAARAHGSRNAHTIAARSAVHVRESVTLRGHELLRVDEGWLPASALRRVAAVSPPADLATDERWVDIDLRRQILVAFEGTRPVYTTLVSSGASAHPTGRGEYRVWVKLATTDMSNADSDTLDTATHVYSVERVPWVMFFHDDQALHGAYWHDRFGTVHSHGCVNLAPRDARWLFAWAPPVMPPGWEAVIPTEAEPGLRVRVR